MDFSVFLMFFGGNDGMVNLVVFIPPLQGGLNPVFGGVHSFGLFPYFLR